MKAKKSQQTHKQAHVQANKKNKNKTNKMKETNTQSYKNKTNKIKQN